MVAAIVLGTVSYYLLVTVCYVVTRICYSRVRATGPVRPAVGPDELGPYELALLSGGRPRVGEVAVAELFLTGRIVAWGPGMVARVPDRFRVSFPPLSAVPFVRAPAARLRDGRPFPVDRLVSSVACGDAVTAALWRLRRLGLFLAPGRLRRVAWARRAAWLSQVGLGAAGALAAGFAVGWAVRADSSLVPLLLALLLAYPFLLHVARRVFGGAAGTVGAAALVSGVSAAVGGLVAELLAVVALFAGWCAAYAVYRCTGGRLGPRTVAGDVLLSEARVELASRSAPDGDALLRTVALLGFEGLRGGCPEGWRGP
ncbi:TIGR04222 domain-containing membrane protein, partial [Thermobifida halotolerans]|uniref:TIGR04222 domain-containing membrane protein n=1 Tax=Thermobifida halotolerans TaxID=483545 RepID=UPI001F3193F0